METEVFVNSLGGNLIGLVEIDDLPLLVLASIVTPYSNSLTFYVFTSFDIKYLVV
jgi:hypothetical protein